MFRKIVLTLSLFLSGFALSQTAEEAIAKARLQYDQHKLNEAASTLKSAIKHFPDCSKCYLELAGVDLRMGDGASALAALDGAVKVAETDQDRADARYYRGTVLINGDKKQLQQAEQDFRETLKLDPRLNAAHLKLGMTLIRELRDEEGLAEVQKYLDSNGPKQEEATARKILLNPRVARDTLAPEFTVQTSEGGQFSLAANHGKIVVIDFWATWCPPCRESVPEIKDLTKRYPAEKLVVISASADKDEAKWRDFIAKKQMMWVQYLDKDGRLAELFGVNAFPTYIVIDRDGFIRKRFEGMNPQESIAHKLRDELKSTME